MEFDVLKVGKYTIKKGKKEYYIYVSFDKEYKCYNFYIGKKDYGFIEYCVGVFLELYEVETFVKEHKDKWINIYEEELEQIEENGE